MYNLVVCGGTFDHFHKGHAAFLQAALQVSEKVLLGITSDIYIQQHKPHHHIQSYNERQAGVENFLADIGAQDRVTVAPIDTVLYPKEWESFPIEAVVTTKETQQGAVFINNDRRLKGLAPLAVYIVPFTADDTGEKIASTNIRQGKISTEGITYLQPSWFSHDLVLPDIERKWFQVPFGQVYDSSDFLKKEDATKLISVGDVVTKECNTLSLHQPLSVIDFTIQRKPAFQNVQELGFTGQEHVWQVKNPAGHITTALVHALEQIIPQLSDPNRHVIVVDGEEDLAVIPLVLALPLHFVIVYGQPHQGIVRLAVTSEAKNTAHSLLRRLIVASN